MKERLSSDRVTKFLYTMLLLCLGLVPLAFNSKSAFGVEKISFSIPVAGEFKVSVESLEIFANEGKMTEEFEFYAKRLDKSQLKQLREALQKRLEVSPAVVSRMTNMPMGKDFLRRMGRVLTIDSRQNGIFAIRSAAILAASNPQGFTAIDFLKQFPTNELLVNTDIILDFTKEITNFYAYNKTTTKAIARQAATEAAQRQIEVSNLQDLTQPGTYEVSKETQTFKIDNLRQTQVWFATNYDLDADIYRPLGLTTPAPLILITHGFGSNRSNLAYLAEHLASYGYIVIAPEHIGSNTEYKEAFERGELSVDISPIEYYSRAKDLTYLLDKLAAYPELAGQIDWERVGVLGHSFGGTTALQVSGAKLNLPRITEECRTDRLTFNVSLLLQCRASYLPPGDYDLRDPRIKAVLAINPVVSSIFGPEGMGEIKIPTLMIGGNKDLATPFVEEQVHPFLWLNTQHKYLATFENGTHSSISNPVEVAKMPQIFQGLRPDVARGYLKTLSLAFFGVYVKDSTAEYRPYLTANYTSAIANRELPLHLISSLTVEQLTQAYEDKPPKPPIPEPVIASQPASSINQEDTLANIQQTGKLKIAMRNDAAPFGYLDSDRDIWTGYCADLADSLSNYLAQKLNLLGGIEVIKISSNLENRFKLVQQHKVHLECGPNKINFEREDVNFSDTFFVSGTRFLVQQARVANVDLNSNLAKIRVGVLQDSVAKQFLNDTYPKATIVSFKGNNARAEGIVAIDRGNIDIFVDDSILLTGELDRDVVNRHNYRLIPSEPLTCDFYGLIMPNNDPLWLKMVNNFLKSDRLKQVTNRWFDRYSSNIISDLDYCINHRS